MDDKKTEHWEHELKNKLENHQESTDAKDFDAFMDKLEGNNFFDIGGKTFSGKWAAFTGLLIAGVAYWMMSGEQPQEKQTAGPSPIETEVVEKVIKTEKTVVDQIEPVESKGVLAPKETFHTPVPVKKHESPVVKEEKAQDQEIVVVEPVEVEVIDTIAPVIEKPKADPVIRKPVIIMSTDTIMVKDTSHVKHRKRDKKKKK